MEGPNVMDSLIRLQNALEYTKKVKNQIQSLREGDANALSLPGLRRPDFVPPLALNRGMGTPGGPGDGLDTYSSRFGGVGTSAREQLVDGGTAATAMDDTVIDAKINQIRTSIAKVEDLLKARNEGSVASSPVPKAAPSRPGDFPRLDPPASSAPWFAPPRSAAPSAPGSAVKKGADTARSLAPTVDTARTAPFLSSGGFLDYPPTPTERPEFSLARPRKVNLEEPPRRPRAVEEREAEVNKLRQSLASTRAITFFEYSGAAQLPDARWSEEKKARLGLTGAWPSDKVLKTVPDLGAEQKRTTFPREPVHPLLAQIDTTVDPEGAKAALDDRIREINNYVNRLQDRQTATWRSSFNHRRRRDNGLLMPSKAEVRVSRGKARVGGYARVMHVNAKFQNNPLLARKSFRGRILPWEARRSLIVENVKDRIPEEYKFTPTYHNAKVPKLPTTLRRRKKKASGAGGKKKKGGKRDSGRPEHYNVYTVPSTLPPDEPLPAAHLKVAIRSEDGGPAVSMTGEELKHKLVAEFRRQLVDEAAGALDPRTLKVLERLESQWAADGSDLQRPAVSLPGRNDRGEAVPPPASFDFHGAALIRPAHSREPRKLVVGRVQKKKKAKHDPKSLPSATKELSLVEPWRSFATTKRALKREGFEVPKKTKGGKDKAAAPSTVRDRAASPAPKLPQGVEVPPAVQRSGRAGTWAKMFERVYAKDKEKGPELPRMHRPVAHSERNLAAQEPVVSPLRKAKSALNEGRLSSAPGAPTSEAGHSFNGMLQNPPVRKSDKSRENTWTADVGEEEEHVAPLRETPVTHGPVHGSGLHRILSGEAFESADEDANMHGQGLGHAMSMPVYDRNRALLNERGQPMPPAPMGAKAPERNNSATELARMARFLTAPTSGMRHNVDQSLTDEGSDEGMGNVNSRNQVRTNSDSRVLGPHGPTPSSLDHATQPPRPSEPGQVSEFGFQSHPSGLPPAGPGKGHRRSSSLWKMVKGAFSRKASSTGEDFEGLGSNGGSASNMSSILGDVGLDRASMQPQEPTISIPRQNSSALEAAHALPTPTSGNGQAPPAQLPATSSTQLEEPLNISMSLTLPPHARIPDVDLPIPEPHTRSPPVHHPAGSLRAGEMRPIVEENSPIDSSVPAARPPPYVPSTPPRKGSNAPVSSQAEGDSTISLMEGSPVQQDRPPSGSGPRGGTLRKSQPPHDAKAGGTLQLPTLDHPTSPGVAFGSTVRRRDANSPVATKRPSSIADGNVASAGPSAFYVYNQTFSAPEGKPGSKKGSTGSGSVTFDGGSLGANKSSGSIGGSSKSPFMSLESLTVEGTKSRGRSTNPGNAPPRAASHTTAQAQLTHRSSRTPSSHQAANGASLSDAMDDLGSTQPNRRSSLRPPSRANSGVPPPQSPPPSSKGAGGSYVQTLKAKEAKAAAAAIFLQQQQHGASKPATPSGTLRSPLQLHPTDVGSTASTQEPGQSFAPAIPPPSPAESGVVVGNTFKRLDSVEEERNRSHGGSLHPNQVQYNNMLGYGGTARGAPDFNPGMASRGQTANFRTSHDVPDAMLSNPDTDAVRRQVLGLGSSGTLLRSAAAAAEASASQSNLPVAPQAGEPSLAFPSGVDPMTGLAQQPSAHSSPRAITNNNAGPPLPPYLGGPPTVLPPVPTPQMLMGGPPPQQQQQQLLSRNSSRGHRRSNSRGSRAASPAHVNPGDKYKARIMKEDPLMVAESVGNVLQKIRLGASMYKHKVGSGGKGQTRLMQCDLAGDKVFLMYKSSFTTKKIEVKGVKVYVSGHASQRPIEIIGMDNKAIQIQPNSVREYTVWAMGMNAALLMRDRQAREHLQRGTNTSVWMLPWHQSVEIIDA